MTNVLKQLSQFFNNLDKCFWHEGSEAAEPYSFLDTERNSSQLNVTNVKTGETK